MFAARPAYRVALTAAVLLILITSAAPVGAAVAHPVRDAAGVSETTGRASQEAPSGHASPRPTSAASSEPPGTATSPVVSRVERQISDHLFDARNAFLPSPYTHLVQPSPGETVSPEPLQSPGPMGLADLGIGPDDQPYGYNTSTFEGTLHLASFAAYSPGYAEFVDAPDWTTIQLNAVGVNLSYPGSSSGTFWFQNVAHFNGTVLQFEDNIWNFSGPTAAMTPGTLSSYNGSVELAEFYFAYGPTVRVTYPFSLTLELQLTVLGGSPTAFFNYSVATGAGTIRGSYDKVVFNGAAVHAPQFRVDGAAYDPFGNEYDAELTIGGDGGGQNANVVALAGSATLERWVTGAGRFENVPSAYDHGVDSGETSVGVAAYYDSNASAVEYLGQGPSFLYGLWNTTSGPAGPAARPGYIRVDVLVAPSYAFLFATNLTLSERTTADADFSYAPSSPSGAAVSELPPPTSGNPYVFAAWADGYQNSSLEIAGNTSHGVPSYLNLTVDRGTVNAPVYLDGDAQVTALGTAGFTGTAYAPGRSTLWINDSTADIAAPFLRLNGFDYPTFVLFAAEDVNATLVVDHFLQSAGSFVYTSSYAFLPLPTAGWTQAYYFFYGGGRFSVTNTTVLGNTTLYYDDVAPPAAIEFYDTTDSTASNIVAEQESFGVAAVGAVTPSFDHVSSTTGANAVSLAYSTDATATAVVTDGTDYTGASSFGAYVYYANGSRLTGVTATGGSDGVFAQNATGLTVQDVRATTVGAALTTYALLLNASSHVTVRNVTADNSVAVVSNLTSDAVFRNLSSTQSSTPSIWENSSHVAVENLSFANESVGAWFLNDSGVAVSNATAVNFSTAVDRFTNSTGGTFENVRALNGSIGVNATFSTDLALHDVSASNASLGAYLANDSSVTATELSASLNSTALLGNHTTGVSITGITVTGASLGTEISNSTGFSVRWANASAAELVPSSEYYAFNPFTFRLQPIAAVALYGDTGGTVANVSAHFYPFAVWANDSTDPVIEGISAWYGNLSVALNSTVGATVAAVFAYGNYLGLNLTNTTDTTLTGSTIEGSTSYGLEIDNGTNVRVVGNNFIANNGASTQGTFQAAHVQAHVNNGTTIEFNTTAGYGNFWSDHTGTGAYVIRSTPAPTIADHEPALSVIHHWLEFYEGGLPASTPWGFTVLGTEYRTSAPLVYLPGWSLAKSPMPYVVEPPARYIPHPAAGTAAPLAGGNETVVITFSTQYTITFAESGLPKRTAWSVTLNGTTEDSTGARATITFNETTGSYAYTIGEVAGWRQASLVRTGTVFVTTESVTEPTLVYTQVVYSVTFAETGLPAKQSWTVSLNGTPLGSTTASVVFTAPNGTFPFTVTSPTGYTSSRSSGSVTINGASIQVNLRFNSTLVSPPPSSSPPWLYIGVGAGVAVVAIGLVAVLLARRRRRPRAPEPPGIDSSP